MMFVRQSLAQMTNNVMGVVISDDIPSASSMTFKMTHGDKVITTRSG